MRLPVTGLAPLAAVECALARSAPKTRVWGFYAACSDHIASDYNKHGGGSLPDGTGVIGLLLIKKGAGAGAYEHYHLGSGRATYGYQVNDAYAVHDQMLWLPIGLAYAH